ncbi:hypothetical protein AAG570_006131 [Ranatra chinensis]|uniref:Uncharacterized protein n=1 Tax=Ranatra chinensis TaxID=642074 RepID=A0ABD0XX54_9HEMI
MFHQNKKQETTEIGKEARDYEDDIAILRGRHQIREVPGYSDHPTIVRGNHYPQEGASPFSEDDVIEFGCVPSSGYPVVKSGGRMWDDRGADHRGSGDEAGGGRGGALADVFRWIEEFGDWDELQVWGGRNGIFHLGLFGMLRVKRCRSGRNSETVPIDELKERDDGRRLVWIPCHSLVNVQVKVADTASGRDRNVIKSYWLCRPTSSVWLSGSALPQKATSPLPPHPTQEFLGIGEHLSALVPDDFSQEKLERSGSMFRGHDSHPQLFYGRKTEDPSNYTVYPNNVTEIQLEEKVLLGPDAFCLGTGYGPQYQP